MRKLLFGFLILMLPLAVCASPIDVTIIDEVTLSASVTSAMSSVVSIADFTNPTFYVLYDEGAGVASNISVAITTEVSEDETNWIDASWFDFAGGPASFQTSESMTVDTNYVGWLEKAANYPFFRLTAIATSDATGSAVISTFMRGVK